MDGMRGQSSGNGSSYGNGKDVFAMTWEQRELLASREDIYKHLEPRP